jgi:hypothetical protein
MLFWISAVSMYSVDDGRCFGHILATAFSCGCAKTCARKGRKPSGNPRPSSETSKRHPLAVCSKSTATFPRSLAA